MINLRAALELRIRAALAAAGAGDQPALVTESSRPEFGDYQANGCMAAAKQLRRSPRELANAVVEHLKADDLIASTEVAGPGFINIRLHDHWLERNCSTALAAPRVLTAAAQQRVVIDYSAPNLAKEMHVGHLRSTIIGDALARVLEHLGHLVIRQNHVGDWGTQFGMLITQFVETGANSTELADLEQFYRTASARFQAEPEFATRARSAVVQLQAGDAQTRERWQSFISASLAHCEALYERLGVSLTRAHLQAESAYNDALAGIVDALRAEGLLVESEGAQCVFLAEFKAKDGTPLPLIIQKSDGGYLYATTDLAAIRYRADVLHADRVLYVVDARQALHFRQVFATARAAGFLPDAMTLEHCSFGSMLGKDGKPFRTRSGETVKLSDLLDEAERRAAVLLAERGDLDETARAEVAKAVSMGAVKYSDLSKHRVNDYIFDWEQMLSFDGNTAPYLQFACTRIRSIFRRAAESPGGAGPVVAPATDTEPATVSRTLHPDERVLAVQLARFAETLDAVARESLPHYLCTYLYDLSGHFMKFYESCTVLDAEPSVRAGRLAFCAATEAVLTQGLGLLGIATVARM